MNLIKNPQPKPRSINPVTIDEAYDHLAKSIVIQAIEDYREILRGKAIHNTAQYLVTRKNLEKFFLSDWYQMLSDYDGKELIKLIKEQEHYHDAVD